MMRLLLALIGFIVISFSAVGQTFTSSIDGNWNDGATWGNTSPGTAGVDFPSTGQNAIIASNVAVPSSFSATISNMEITPGVTLDIAPGGTLNLNAALTIDDDGLGGNGFLNIEGLLIANQGSSFTGDSPTTVTVFSTGTYQHNLTTSAGSIIGGVWDTGSTCLVSGYTTNCSAPGNLGQSFANFSWNCPNFIGTVGVCGTSSAITFMSLAGSLTTVGGNMTVSSTGGSSRTLRLFDTSGGNTLTVGGDVILNSSSRLVLSSTGTGNLLSVAGNFNVSNTIASGHTLASSGSATLSVTGNFLLNASAATTVAMASLGGGSGTLSVSGNLTLSPSVASTLNMASTSTSTGAINLSGNFSANSTSTLSSSASAGSTLTFNGSSVQTFTNSATIGKINFKINTGSILDLGTSALIGTGGFTLLGGATMRVGSPDGLTTAATGLGNIKVSGTRTYTANGNIIYNGTSSQNLGNEWSSTGSLNGVAVNLEIANTNSSGVTNNIIGSTNLVGNLKLTNGPLNIGNSNTLVIQKDVTVTGGTIGGLTSSNLTISGSGTITGSLNFATGSQNLNNLTFQRNATLTLGSSLTIAGTIDLSTAAAILDFSGQTLTMNGTSIINGSGGLKSSSSSNLVFGGSSFSGSVPFSGSGNQLNTLTFGTTTSTGFGTYTWNNNVTVTNVNLSSGTLTHTAGLTMASGGIFTKGAGTFTVGSVSPVATTSYDVIYNGSGNTDVELPSVLTALNNLTVASSGTITLASAATVNGVLTLSGGTFSAGSNNLTLKGNFVSNSASTLTSSTVTFAGTTTISGSTTPTFGAVTVSGTLTPSSTLQINGNLIDNGTLNAGTGTVVFGGTTAITGSATPSFNNVTINNTSTLTAPSGTMNVAGNLVNNGTFSNNGGTVAFNGTSTLSGSSTTSLFGVTISGTFTAPSGSLNIAGNWATTGTFNHNNGKVILNGGSSAQSITGTVSVNDVDAGNANGVNVNGNMNLFGILTLVSGTFDADGSGGGVLTIKSPSRTSSGRIAALGTPGNFSGLVTVERYINGPDDWRYLSMPITNGTVGTWKANFPVTGNFSDPSPVGVNGVISSSSPSIYFWNSGTQAWVSIGSGASTSSTTLDNLTGYSAYSYISSDFTASVRGNVRTGAATVPISSSNFSLVPNPYPSPIAWNNMNRTGLSNTIYIRASDNNGTVVYAAYIAGGAAGSGTNAPPGSWQGEVAIGQSFWVQSTGATSVNLVESAKTNSSYNYFLRESALENYFRIVLSSDKQRDESVIHFSDNATMAFDNDYDAIKMRNGYYIPNQVKNSYLNVSTFLGDTTTEYAINSISKLKCNTTIGMKVTDLNPGSYSLSFENLETMSVGYQMVLVDHFTKAEKLIDGNLKYSFSVTSDKATYGNSRFEVRFLLPGSVWVNSVAPPKTSITSACDFKTLGLSVDTQLGVTYQFFNGSTPISNVLTGSGSAMDVAIAKDQIPAGSNDLNLQVATLSGCDQYTFAKVVTYNNQQLSPVVINKDGLTLKSSSASANQWYKDGVAIDGATGATYEVNESAIYTVKVDEGGCTISADISVDLVKDYIQVFPVPTDGKVNIILPDAINKSLTGMAIYDMRGANLLEEKASQDLQSQEVKTLDLSNFDKGMYVLQINADKVYPVKIVKK